MTVVLNSAGAACARVSATGFEPSNLPGNISGDGESVFLSAWLQCGADQPGSENLIILLGANV